MAARGWGSFRVWPSSFCKTLKMFMSENIMARALIFGMHVPWVALYQDYENNFDRSKNMVATGVTIFNILRYSTVFVQTL